jgi:16S rRNA processing protein RimM
MWRPHGPGTCVLHLQGIDDRTAAEALVGRELVLQAGAQDVEPPPAPLPFQLRGLRVELVDGGIVGEIAAVLKMPAQDVMVVRGADREHLIPNVAPIVREVDWGGARDADRSARRVAGAVTQRAAAGGRVRVRRSRRCASIS